MKTVHKLGSGAWQRVPGGRGEGWRLSIIRLTGALRELTPFHSLQGALRSGLESKPKCLRATYITGILDPSEPRVFLCTICTIQIRIWGSEMEGEFCALVFHPDLFKTNEPCLKRKKKSKKEKTEHLAH